MNNLVSRVWYFIKTDFSVPKYALVLLLAMGLIGINYFISPLETGLINKLPGGPLRSLGYFLLYSFSYYTASFIILNFNDRLSILTEPTFWLLSIAGIVIFSLDSGFWLPQLILNGNNLKGQTYSFYFSLISNGKGIITISSVLLLINFLTLENKQEKLGLNKEGNLKPFLILLVTIAPFILISALDRGLSNYYPTFKYFHIAELWNSPEWVPVIFYEFIYGADFFNIELFFRGFLVIGLSTVLGRDAILPMAIFYCTIHFGKPLAECISSLLGGYLLGIVAFETRNIWGGVMLHIGVAWLMEMAAAISNYYGH